MTIALRSLVGEFLGTAMLLFIIVGSGIVVETTTDDGALALFAHAVIVGAGLAALIAFLAAVSGAHFNPAVSFGFLIDGAIGGRTALIYVGAQLVGAVVGVGLANATFGGAVLTLSTTERAGAGRLTAEFVATFILVLLILGLVRSRRTAAVAPAVGAWVAAIVFATVSTGFANPAVTVARAATDSYTGIAPASVAGYVTAQIAAGAAAAYAASFLFPDRAMANDGLRPGAMASPHPTTEEVSP
jgi:glycerol uptake facilitator-like aquaporin